MRKLRKLLTAFGIIKPKKRKFIPVMSKEEQEPKLLIRFFEYEVRTPNGSKIISDPHKAIQKI